VIAGLIKSKIVNCKADLALTTCGKAFSLARFAA